MDIGIITCGIWGARAPKQDIDLVNKARRIIFHHTAGHHAEIDNPGSESVDEAMAYARAIQNYHMDVNGWIDSGHNFLVCRNGSILQGRWLTVSAIQSVQMVSSAHCPGQNDQVGIEHEHRGAEEMTAAQRESSALLMAWIAWKYQRSTALPVFPHSAYFPTSCPANLTEDISSIKARANTILGDL